MKKTTIAYSFGVFMLILITPLIAAPKDPIILQGDSVITQFEFDGRISRIPEQDQQAFLRDGSRVEKVLRQLIMDKRLADAARKTGFDKNPLVQKRLKLAMESELADAWLDSIEASKVNSADYEQMAKEYYLTHKNDFIKPETIDVSHILISTKERSAEEAVEIATKIYTKIEENPEVWNDMVKEYSEDPGSRSNNGAYMAVVRGKMVKPFEDTAFSLQNTGDISSPVKTNFGYHIIRLDKKNPAHLSSYSEVKEKIIRAQKRDYARKERMGYITQINTEVPLVIPDCAIEEMMVRYFDDPAITESYNKCVAKIEK